MSRDAFSLRMKFISNTLLSNWVSIFWRYTAAERLSQMAFVVWVRTKLEIRLCFWSPCLIVHCFVYFLLDTIIHIAHSLSFRMFVNLQLKIYLWFYFISICFRDDTTNFFKKCSYFHLNHQLFVYRYSYYHKFYNSWKIKRLF